MNDAEMAKRVLMHDATDTTTASGCATAIGSVYQKLHYRLVPLIGVNGMRALFARSVQMTCAAFPQLPKRGNVELSHPIDSAQRVAELIGQQDKGFAWAATTALYANFIGLCNALIGERQSLLILQRAFPKAGVSAGPALGRIGAGVIDEPPTGDDGQLAGAAQQVEEQDAVERSLSRHA